MFVCGFFWWFLYVDISEFDVVLFMRVSNLFFNGGRDKNMSSHFSSISCIYDLVNMVFTWNFAKQDKYWSNYVFHRRYVWFGLDVLQAALTCCPQCFGKWLPLALDIIPIWLVMVGIWSKPSGDKLVGHVCSRVLLRMALIYYTVEKPF